MDWAIAYALCGVVTLIYRLIEFWSSRDELKPLTTNKGDKLLLVVSVVFLVFDTLVAWPLVLRSILVNRDKAK